MNTRIRESICGSSLIHLVYEQFSKIPDPRQLPNTNRISFSDVLMAGLAIFGLKFPSLLQYDQKRRDSVIDKNLKTLYHVTHAPSDTYLRERLDELDPDFIRPAFKKIFARFQRRKCLEEYEFMEGHYILSIDGTGEFSSAKVCCKHCCKKESQIGTVSYYHQMLGTCIVHPEKTNVIPLCPEVIQNQDGETKNDCERNASKRFIENFRREHPHLKVIVVEDGLASNGPHIKLLEEHKMKYIIGAKPGDHKHLFDTINESEESKYYEFKDDKGFIHQFRYINDVALNKSHPNLKVNFFEYMQTDAKGKEAHFSWVTNIKISENNIYKLMRGGRSIWKIENETFNTLKNLGYNFEHNYGHGKEYLATVFCLLMMLTFLIDQIQEITCGLFRAVKKYAGTYRGLWETMRVLFQYVGISSWEEFYHLISKKKFTNTT
ncbi:MAG: transposase [Parachlamydiaceae bacterium]|nr:transposase [Parachlamydiaceae bacterium]